MGNQGVGGGCGRTVAVSFWLVWQALLLLHFGHQRCSLLEGTPLFLGLKAGLEVQGRNPITRCLCTLGLPVCRTSPPSTGLSLQPHKEPVLLEWAWRVCIEFFWSGLLESLH